MESIYYQQFIDEYNNYGIPILNNESFHNKLQCYQELKGIPEEYDNEIDNEIDIEMNLNENEIRDIKKINLDFNKIKNEKFRFLNNEYNKILNKIEQDYDEEVIDCVKKLPQNFSPARGRGRVKQLKTLSSHQIKMEEKIRLVKNKYCAKKVRIKKKESILKSEAQIYFLQNKIKKYEEIFEKLFSKIN
jgi:hypothetical protein